MSQLNKESVEQAGGDERKLSDLGNELHNLSCSIIHENEKLAEQIGGIARELWNWPQARAALAQPSPVRSSLLINGYQLRAALDFIAPDGTAEQLESEACIEWRQQDADFLEAGLYAFCAEYPEEGGVLLDEEPTTAQPSPLQSEQAEAERPEVVAVMESNGAGGKRLAQRFPIVNVFVGDELMTVAQHGRIVEARWNRAMDLMGEHVARISEKFKAERDAALARVAELEKQEPLKLSADVREFLQEGINSVMGGEDADIDYEFAGQLGKLLDPVYAAPVAQAQQLHDLDAQCRYDVARALGLRPSQERGFAWSYLLASIKSCVKASEDAAQAQHSAPIAPELKRALGLVVAALEADGDRPTSKYALSELKKVLAAAPGNSAQHSVPGDIMRDAQRYRWLRDQQFYFSFSTENSDAGISSCTAGMSSRFKNLSWVDAAIDSAIAAAPGKEVGHE
ncbi:TPA: hypothetical protein ACNIOI_000039 [Pseudomonas aeruginosa]